MITVTKPFLPPKNEFNEYIDQIWKNNWLTNNGPFVKKLESSLKDYLKVDNLLFLSNGTIALQFAIKALQLKGEIITTPFTYIATSSSIVWENCSPVFSDIDPESFNLDPVQLEEAINKNTTAILATHVFGNPCDIDRIHAIGEKYNLKIIYDAAHCFGVRFKGQSVLNFGDISTISFHATKLFHTIEGGAVISGHDQLNKLMGFYRNFGHDGPGRFSEIGINGKNSEFHAAMGLCNLKFIDNILEQRKLQYELYVEALRGENVELQNIHIHADYNHAYFPVVFETEEKLLDVQSTLERHNISPRRYFYPALNKLEIFHGNAMPVAEKIASNILCLPLYHNLTKEIQELICHLILEELNS